MQSDRETLRGRDYILLLVIAIVVDLLLISIQPVPGYMDAAYYYTTGIQLAKGHGFNEPFIWNYLDNSETLPHPSHSYWYPLASMVAGIGMIFTGRQDFFSARIFFLLTAVIFPLAVASLSVRITKKRRVGLLSGFLAIFCGYYLPFIVTTDNYALYILLGALYFMLLDNISYGRVFLLGVLAGLMNLARGDGLLWLPLTLVVGILLIFKKVRDEPTRTRFLTPLLSGFLILGGYLLGMGGWLARNMAVFGSLTPPATRYLLWMTDYNQIYSFTPELFTCTSWLAVGWKAILQVRLVALWQNFGTALMAQGLIFLFPLILVGGWKNRHLSIVKFGVFAWLILLIAESFLFPFASIQGGFFHAGAALQPLWFVLAPLGFDTILDAFFRENKSANVKPFLRFLLVVLVVVMSGMLVKMRVLDKGWNEGEYRYLQAEQILVENGATPDQIVMTINPPAYNAMTGRQAIVLPVGDFLELFSAASEFNADYIILERDRLRDPFVDIYEHPENHPEFVYIGGFEDVRIFSIKDPD